MNDQTTALLLGYLGWWCAILSTSPREIAEDVAVGKDPLQVWEILKHLLTNRPQIRKDASRGSIDVQLHKGG